MKSLITILVPCYNEEEVVGLLYEQLILVLDDLPQYDFEVLFVDDGSRDRTLEVIKALKSKDHRIEYVEFSRNFGKETAMLAGMDYASGDALITLDADLQHPPEKIKEMIYWWEKGYDDVYTVRDKKSASKFNQWASSVYYRILEYFTQEEIYPHAGDFRLLDRKCIDSLVEMRENHRYTKGMYSWIGFKKKELTYEEGDRAAGKTHWSFIDLIQLAIDGLTSYSVAPLRLSSFVGLVISGLAFLFLLFEIIKVLIYNQAGSGYATLLVAVLFLGGIQLIFLGVIGEYLGKVFVESKERPNYLVQESSKEISSE